MKKILFYVDHYWELPWIYRVAKELDAPVYSENPPTREAIQAWGLNLSSSANEGDILVLVYTHMGRNYDISENYLKSNRQVVIMQHAFDSSLHVPEQFWGRPTNHFSYFLVGCQQDARWLGAKHGDKVILTGMPRLDDLRKVLREQKKPVDDLPSAYYLSIIPNDTVFGQAVLDKYLRNLPQEVNTPIVYKAHPGADIKAVWETVSQVNGNAMVVDDPVNDPFYTYRLIKNATAVVCLESFIAIEASLLGKPVIFYGHELLENNFYGREDNPNQTERLPIEMSSGFFEYVVNAKQEAIAANYLCDGQNTKRVVKFLKGLIA